LLFRKGFGSGQKVVAVAVAVLGKPVVAAVVIGC
jgi:hypothetical protein